MSKLKEIYLSNDLEKSIKLIESTLYDLTKCIGVNKAVEIIDKESFSSVNATLNMSKHLINKDGSPTEELIKLQKQINKIDTNEKI